MYPALSFGEFWEHQLRWARTVRLVRPGSYFGLIVTHGLAWAIAAAIAAPTVLVSAGYLVAYLALRLAVA